MKVLGKSIVAWRAEGGAWSVVEDSCPHRMAPLSLGFINEEKQLVCRYHGWEFNGDGKATSIPMSTDEKAREGRGVGRGGRGHDTHPGGGDASTPRHVRSAFTPLYIPFQLRSRAPSLNKTKKTPCLLHVV